MTTTPIRNGGISPLSKTIIGILLAATMLFAGILTKNLRYEMNKTSAEAAKNTTMNAEQKAQIMSIDTSLKRIEKNQDKMSDTLETILIRTSNRR